MCHSTKLINITPNGIINHCTECNVFHLQFKNLFFEFTPHEFSSFENYLSDIDSDYWEEKCGCSSLRKKIPIPTLQQNLLLLFDRDEVEELITLITKRPNLGYLRAHQIQYKPHLN